MQLNNSMNQVFVYYLNLYHQTNQMSVRSFLDHSTSHVEASRFLVEILFESSLTKMFILGLD